MGLTKAQLEALNISSFPDNTSELITPEILRNYNSASIANTVNQEAYNVDSASFKALIDALDPSGSAESLVLLNNFTASQLTINTGYNTFTQSADSRLDSLESTTASLLIETQNLELFSASALTSISNLNASSASQQVSINSLNQYTQSNDTKWSDLGAKSGSWVTESETSSFARTNATNTFTAKQTFTADIITNALTASGLIYPNVDNGALSFIQTDGAGNLSLQYVQQVFETIRNMSGVTLAKGTPVYISGSTGDNGNAYIADASNVLKMPAVYIAGETLGVGATGLALLAGKIEGVDTSAYIAGTEIYVAEGGGYTSSRPSGSNSIVQKLGVVQKQGVGGQGVIINQLEAILPNIQTGYAWVGNGSNQPVAVATSSFGGGGGTIDTGSLVTTASFNSYTQSTNVRLNNIESTTASLLVETQNLELFSASALISLSNLNTATASLFTSTSLSLTTASFSGNTLTFSKGDGSTFGIVIPDVSGSTIDTGSFATTGSNTFTGDQTLIDNAGNFFTISDASGSMMLVAKGFTSASAHISASSAGIGNFIFKTNSNTPDTIISGSSNIFQNATAPQVGFKRYLTSANISLGGGLSQVSGSMQFSPGVNNNYLAGTLTMRGPVSSSAYNIATNNILGAVLIGSSAANNAEKLTSGLIFTTNNIQGTLNIIANQAFLTGSTTTFVSNNVAGGTTLTLNSSAASLTNNIINDSGFTLTNNYFSSSVGLGIITVSRNNIAGQSNIINITGSQPAGTTNATSYSDNFIGGASNTLHADVSNARVVGANAYHSATRNIIFGNNLIVSASSLLTDTSTLGSAFFGRFNAADTNRNKTTETIFAVGTGTSTSNRKTGFLIDSGSNSFFEGTVNISGSLLVNGIAPAAVDTGSFATTGSNSFNGNQIITGSLLVSEGLNLYTSSQISIGRFPADIATNLRFGNAAMSSNVSGQSGIAIGLGAMQFLTTFSQAIAIGANTMANAVNPQSSIAIGGGAMQYSSGSNQSIAIGQSALQFSSGSFNTAIGGGALSKNTIGGNNFAMGSNAMFENTTGNQNLAIGIGAMYSNTTGNLNTAIGNDAMIFSSASTVTYNVAIGSSALSRNQTDSQIAIGANALENATTGNANTAIGRLALTNTTTGTDNVALGSSTLFTNITGERNIGIGTAALRNTSVNASRNIGIGTFSLYNVKSNNNVAIGHASFENLQSGSTNVAIGWNSGLNIINGNYNTLIGGNLRGQSDWDRVVAISDGESNIKFFNSGSQTTITNDTLISGSLTTTGSANIGTVMTLTPLDPLPAGTIGMLAVSSSNQLFFYNGAWTQIS